MGKYMNAVAEFKSRQIGLTYAAIDFTNMASGEYVNDGEVATPQNATVTGTVENLGHAVGLPGNSNYIQCRLSGVSEYIACRSWLIGFVPKQDEWGNIKSGYVFEQGQGQTSGTIVCHLFLYTDGKVQINLGNNNYTIATGHLVADIPNYLSIIEQGSYSYHVLYNDVNGGLFGQFTGWDRNFLDQWVRFGCRRNSTTAMEIDLLYFAVGADYMSPWIASEIPALESFYGKQVLATNLEAARAIASLTLGPGRITAQLDICEAGATTINPYIYEEQGQLIEFFAFDSDEASSVLTTGPVAVNPAEPLVFNPVTGSGGGGSTTGLLAHIAGTVNIDGTAAEREVIVISDDPAGRKVLGQGTSAPDGTFDINYNDWGGAVIALALDNYGGDWSASTALTTGTIIHPTTPNGYVYEVTASGTTGTTEPTWSINGSVNDGSVTFNPRPFYRPIASGPLAGEVLQEGTPTGPTPYRFFRIIITANNGNSFTGLNEIELRGTQAGADITTPTTVVTTTSEYSANTNYVIENVIDDDPVTVWFNDQGVLPLTIEVDLGSEQAVAWLSMMRGSLSDPSLLGQCPKDFSVEASTNGTDWVSLAAFGSVTDWVADEPYLFVLQAE